MNKIDPVRHPLLYSIYQGAQWAGQDSYPAWTEWADEHERYFQFVHAAGVWDHYKPRLQGLADQRDEALAEVAAAYFLGAMCGYPITEWEPHGEAGSRGDFLLSLGESGSMFVEVKSPGWEAEIVQDEGRNSPRLSQPKYIHAEARSTAPWAAVRHAVAKAYPKLPNLMPTLLIINDDLFMPLNDSRLFLDIALYCPRAKGYADGYLAEDGCFATNRCERLGAVGVLNVQAKDGTVEYLFRLFHNLNAADSVTVPRATFPGYPHFDGSNSRVA